MFQHQERVAEQERTHVSRRHGVQDQLGSGRLMALQRVAGNRAVTALVQRASSGSLETHRAIHTYPFQATIRKSSEAVPPPRPLSIPATEADSVAGASSSPLPDLVGSVASTMAGIVGVVDSPLGGSSGQELPRTVLLPDVVYPMLAEMPETDKPIPGPVLTYGPTVTQLAGSPAGGEFGVTNPYDFRMTGTSVTETATEFTVRTTVSNLITFQVATPTGSGGQKDVPSNTAPVIKAGNYAAIADDLKPNMTDLNGRPPRANFYAVDLTTKHERYHCTDGQTYARQGSNLAQAWLATQRVNDIAGVQALIATIPGRVIATRQAAMTYPGREERAYGDGAPDYRARSDSIRAKGVAGSYPA